jgi:hypothetical protein
LHRWIEPVGWAALSLLLAALAAWLGWRAYAG